jgi:two-component system, OmpR family, response regulator
LKLPGAVDGIGLLTELRRLSPKMVVVMLTGYATLDSAISALRLGAHDYLTKPITMSQLIESVERGLMKQDEESRRRELVGRIEETLRELKSADAAESEPLDRFTRKGALTIDRQKRIVVLENQPIALSTTEFDVLDYLTQHAEHIVSARELLKAMQGYDLQEKEALPIVRVHIQRLRQKLQDRSDHPRFIANVRGKGYHFIG